MWRPVCSAPYRGMRKIRHRQSGGDVGCGTSHGPAHCPRRKGAERPHRPRRRRWHGCAVRQRPREARAGAWGLGRGRKRRRPTSAYVGGQGRLRGRLDAARRHLRGSSDAPLILCASNDRVGWEGRTVCGYISCGSHGRGARGRVGCRRDIVVVVGGGVSHRGVDAWWACGTG